MLHKINTFIWIAVTTLCLTGIASQQANAGVPVPQVLPYEQDFEAGRPSTDEGWEYYCDGGGIVSAAGSKLHMFSLDFEDGDPGYGLSEAILHVDLRGKQGVYLELCHETGRGESCHPLPRQFPDHYNGDGIALSVNGSNWFKLVDFIRNDYFIDLVLDWVLHEACQAAGTADVSDVQIKFQRYGRRLGLEAGRWIDDIRITSNEPTPQVVPYQQNFSHGLPSLTDGWEYFSVGMGWIGAVDGRLRMVGGDVQDDASWGYNEATLHVNLTGKTDLLLTLDHWKKNDSGNGSLPESFMGRIVEGEGISLSVDGVYWVLVTQLTTDFTGRVFDLDEALERAQDYAGTTNVSDVRIRIQASMWVGGIREFDNIRICEQFLPIPIDPLPIERHVTPSGYDKRIGLVPALPTIPIPGPPPSYGPVPGPNPTPAPRPVPDPGPPPTPTPGPKVVRVEFDGEYIKHDDYDTYTVFHDETNIYVTFDSTIDPWTVTANTFTVMGEGGTVDGSYYLLNEGYTIVFDPDGRYCRAGAGDDWFDVTLVGTPDNGSDVMKSTQDIAIDGDADGNPGGDFEFSFFFID